MLAACLVVVGAAAGVRQAAPLAGIDHIPIAVRDLEQAGRRYQALGFALKPGGPHTNGIRNLHVKFPDGTELELITAPEARDDLTRTYRRHLDLGDGPAFLALFAPDADRLAGALALQGRAFRRNGAILTLPKPDPLAYVFFGPRNASPTDSAEHFTHANTAESLVGVWLAGDLSAERALIRSLGVRIQEGRVFVPQPETHDVATVGDGLVTFLPPDRQIVPGRPIVGATLRVRNLATARRVLDGAGLAYTIGDDAGVTRLFLAPAGTHGLWLELLGPA